MKRWLPLFVFLAGCTVGPNYRDPCVKIPDTWNGVSCNAAKITVCEPPPAAWWEVFCDPLLTTYIQKGAECNKSLIAAEYNIVNARALKQVAASKLYPQVNAAFNALRLKLSKTGPFELLGEEAARRRFFPDYLTLFSSFLDASWEVDLFGKTRRNIEAATAGIGVELERRNDLLLTIFAEIASNYFEMRGYQQQMMLTTKNIEVLAKNVEIVRAQLLSGYRNGLDVERVEAELSRLRAQLPDLEAGMYRGIYAISILTGCLPETLVCEMLQGGELPCPPLNVAVGIRGEILRRRPDVREAERMLAQATAHIGVAVASFYPSVNLYAIAGFASTHFRELFRASSLTWLVDGYARVPVFDGGNLMGNLCSARAQAGRALALYQEKVLEAVGEAEGDLVAYAGELATSAALEETTIRNSKVVEITDARLQLGLVSITDLLDAQRQLINSELDFTRSRTQALLELVALYKSLGGGWECMGCSG